MDFWLILEQKSQSQSDLFGSGLYKVARCIEPLKWACHPGWWLANVLDHQARQNGGVKRSKFRRIII
jgi:hypothetical protein